MTDKAVLVLVDGMRPDGMLQCGHPFVQELISLSAYAPDARTCFPSVTLPCHMSLFHSVDPDRHGILTNTYVPQVRPIDGLFEQLEKAGRRAGMFYTWEPLRDLARPGMLDRASYIRLRTNENTDIAATDAAISYIKEKEPDFVFLYLGETDEAGHDKGWMSPEYLGTIHTAFGCVRRVYESLPAGYSLIVTADHGGHARSHGDTCGEDMTIPILFCGPRFGRNTSITGASIKDIAPTVAALLGVDPAREWEGTVRV